MHSCIVPVIDIMKSAQFQCKSPLNPEWLSEPLTDSLDDSLFPYATTNEPTTVLTEYIPYST